MIVNSTQVISLPPYEAHNTADGSGSKEGYFVTIGTNAGYATLVAATSTVPDGVIVDGYPLSSLNDQIALMGFAGIVNVAVTTGETIAAGDFGMVSSDGSVAKDTSASGRIRVCQFLEASGTSGISGIVERLKARLIEPITH